MNLVDSVLKWYFEHPVRYGIVIFSLVFLLIVALVNLKTIIEYIKTAVFEIKKVSWLEPKNALKLSFAVVVISLIAILVVTVIDLALKAGFREVVNRFN